MFSMKLWKCNFHNPATLDCTCRSIYANYAKLISKELITLTLTHTRTGHYLWETYIYLINIKII